MRHFSHIINDCWETNPATDSRPFLCRRRRNNAVAAISNPPPPPVSDNAAVSSVKRWTKVKEHDTMSLPE